MSKDAQPPTEQEEGPRSFSVVLGNLDAGAVQNELSARLHTLVTELERRAYDSNLPAKGKLVFSLEVKVDPKGVAELIPTIGTKLPDPKCSRTVMYVTKGGNLAPENARQQKLGFREVQGGKRETREPQRNADQRDA